jgi:hypothetical protein
VVKPLQACLKLLKSGKPNDYALSFQLVHLFHF